MPSRFSQWLLPVLSCLGWLTLPAIAPGGPAPELPEPGAFTPDELLQRASGAYQSGDFRRAEAFFLALERDFGTEPQLEDAIARNKPLIALCKIAGGRVAEARPYIEASLEQPNLPRDIREELSFWLAIQLMQEGHFREAQHGFGKFFQQPDFSLVRRQEALLLFGTCYVVQEYHWTAAEFFAHQTERLRATPGGTEYAGRAVVTQLLAQIESGQLDEALALVRTEFPRLDQITQLISFQTLALQLGSRFLEEERYHDAIACLQRIWPRERLLTRQRERLVELRGRRARLAGDPRRQSAVYQLDGRIRRVERELENFQGIKEFDAALRFRLAHAFQGLQRYREAALIMEDMLERLEPGPTVEAASRSVIQCWSAIERWPRAVEAAEDYLVAFGDDPANEHLPHVLFLQADALMRMQENAQAASIFETIASSFPDHPLIPKALFLFGFCNLLLDANEAAIAAFDVILENHPGDSMEQDAFYWKGMALSFLQDYAAARDHMARYLKTYRDDGLRHESEAVFRIAYCTFCLADYETAISQFERFLETYGDEAPDADEARLLLGDALLGMGRSDEGIAAYRSIRPESPRGVSRKPPHAGSSLLDRMVPRAGRKSRPRQGSLLEHAAETR